MAVTSESVRASMKISYDDGETWNYTVSRLNTKADANSLMLLAEAVSAFQGAEPVDLLSTSESQLISN